MAQIDDLVENGLGDSYGDRIMEADNIQYLTNLRETFRERTDMTKERRNHYITLINVRLRQVFREGYKKIVTYP